MVLVILQHSYTGVINYQLIHPLIHMVIMGITSCAAVAFVSISGMMYSYFLFSEPNWRSRYKHYCMRAALLLALHPVIKLMSGFSFLFRNVNPTEPHLLLIRLFIHSPITDAIGISILIAPLFIMYMGPIQRAIIIISMLMITVFINAFVIPSDPHLLILKEAIFGSLGSTKLFWFSLVPWLSIFLTGSFMGHALMQLKNGTLKASALIQAMNKAGIILTVLSVILTTGYYSLKIILHNFLNPNFFLAVHPGQTTTLLPGYLAFLILLLVMFLKRIDILGQYGRLAWLLSILGRTSLFTFVVQFAVVKGIPEFLGYKGTLGLIGFLTLFITGLAIIFLLSYTYGRLKGWINKDDYEESLRIIEQLARKQYPFA